MTTLIVYPKMMPRNKLATTAVITDPENSLRDSNRICFLVAPNARMIAYSARRSLTVEPRNIANANTPIKLHITIPRIVSPRNPLRKRFRESLRASIENFSAKKVLTSNNRLICLAVDVVLACVYISTRNRLQVLIDVLLDRKSILAMTNPLLEVSYEGGTGALIHITGGNDLKLDEVNLVGEYVSKQLDPEAQVIWGSRIDPGFKGKIRVITIVTGVKSPYILGPMARDETAKREFTEELGIHVIR